MVDIIPVKLAEQVASSALGVAANAGGDEIVYNGEPIVLVARNGHSASQTVTITATKTSAALAQGPVAVADRSIVLAAGETKAIRISDPFFLLNANNKIGLSYSGVTALTLMALRP